MPVSILLLTCLPVTATADEELTVAIFHKQQKSYVEALSSLHERLKSSGYRIHDLVMPNKATDSDKQEALRQLREIDPDIIVCVGTSETVLVAKEVVDKPVVFMMVMNILNSPLVDNGVLNNERLAGVTADVSFADQLRWIKKTCPKARSIGVLHSFKTAKNVLALELAGEEHALQFVLVETTKSEFLNGLEQLKQSSCDGVLMILDSGVYNATTIKRMLLWGIQEKKPVWTFSPKVVKAGAMAGIYCNGRASGQQAAQMVHEILQGREPSQIGLQYPSQVDNAINERTAAMLGLRVPSGVVSEATEIFNGK